MSLFDQDQRDLWTVTGEEKALLTGMSDKGRFAFIVQLKFMQEFGRFPDKHDEVNQDALLWVAAQMGAVPESFTDFYLDSRQNRRYRHVIRSILGFRPPIASDLKKLSDWISEHVLPFDPQARHGCYSALAWLREQRLEPPSHDELERVIRSVAHKYETDLQETIFTRLSEMSKAVIDQFLREKDADDLQISDSGPIEGVTFNDLKTDPGRPSLDSLLSGIAKVKKIDSIGLVAQHFVDLPTKFIDQFFRRCASESTRELRRHSPTVGYSMVAMFCWRRRQQLIDKLIDLLLQLIHNLSTRAEKKIDSKLFVTYKKVRGKTKLLFKLAEATVNQPEGVIKDVVYPVVAQKKLQEIIAEFQTLGLDFEQEVQETIRASYGNHYRRMLSPVLDTLEFQSNNSLYRPVIDALVILRDNRDSHRQFYNAEEVPLIGVVPKKWRDIVIEKTKNGDKRINRIDYEICVLQALRKRLRTKEIWVVGADRYRDPEQDLPSDFSEKRDNYYELLKAPKDAKIFISKVQTDMHQWLSTLNEGVPSNAKLKLRQQGKKRIHLSPLDKQADPPNTAALKREIGRRWADMELIDIIKEVDLRLGFTSIFRTSASRETLHPAVLQQRLLLCLFGLGTNVGLKRIASQQPNVTFEELRYVKRRFVNKEALRAAITEIVNGTFRIRQPTIWGEATTACASDSKKFGAYDQNLMTEWHARYGGRGIMIYWHVEKHSTCIYSQLRRCSSSEVAAMMTGVLRHCTDMKIDHQYVDSHGQSEVAFAFSYILGFDLLPRLKAIARQKLYLPEANDSDRYSNLDPVLTRAINWDMISQQYDELIKYTTALRVNTAEPESILRRFTRGDVAHPTYLALAELGKAIKTVFLCRYLHSEPLRRRIHEGLNVVENWNSANNFIFYGDRGEFTTNQVEDQEISVLSMHLLQSSLVYVNTLLIQEVLSEDSWMKRMTPSDWRALSPLIYHHVNPYGRIELDMVKRISLAN